MKTEISQAGSNNGFSLLELLVVLLILSISLSVILVSVDITHEKTILKESARKVYSLVRYAREVSALKKIPVSIQSDREGRSLTLVEYTGNVITAYNPPATIHLEGGKILFQPSGYTSGGSILIKDSEGRAYEVTVNPGTGNISLRRLS